MNGAGAGEDDVAAAGADDAQTLWAVVECARGQAVRSRLDPAGRPVRVRTLPAGVVYPYNYGYLEGTRVEDGEELDVFVLGPARPPGTRLSVVVIGAVAFADRRGDDPKLLAVECGRETADRLAETLAEAAGRVAEFLRSYKDAREPRRVGGALGPQAAAAIVEQARRARLEAGATGTEGNAAGDRSRSGPGAKAP